MGKLFHVTVGHLKPRLEWKNVTFTGGLLDHWIKGVKTHVLKGEEQIKDTRRERDYNRVK